MSGCRCGGAWEWDHENPPGYVCDKCGDAHHACAFCEEPSTNEFCSELCEAQYAEETEADEARP